MSIVANRKAYHDYFVEEKFEAGLALEGWEVKAIRAGRAQLKEALENAVSQIETVAGRFLQVSNMRYSFDTARPVGDRVTGAQIGDGKGGYTALDPAGILNPGRFLGRL